MTGEPRHVKTLLWGVRDVAASISAPGVERPTHYGPIMQLYSRLRDTYDAMLDLIARRFGHEATILARPLFTESLMLGELAAVGEPDRATLVIGWWMRSLTDLEGMYDLAERLGDDKTILSMQRELLKSRRQEFQRYARRRGAGTKTWKPNEPNMAHKQGRERDLVDFEFANLFVHAGARILEARATRDADGILGIGRDRIQLEGWATNAALFGARSMLEGTRSICTILELEEPTAVDATMGEIQSWRDRFRWAD